MQEDIRFERYSLDVLNCNAQGAVVLKGSVWRRSNTRLVLTVYAYTGVKAKRQAIVARTTVVEDYGTTRNDTVLENMALLWAMQHGVSDFEFTRRNADHSKLFHPKQLTKENQS